MIETAADGELEKYNLTIGVNRPHWIDNKHENVFIYPQTVDSLAIITLSSQGFI